ncbi:MAG: dicarboxylate/amino acid:cation symporter [Parvularculaceae bacterium]
MSWWFGIKLWKRVMLGLALGVLFGLAVVQPFALGPERGAELLTELKVIGDLFIALIRLIIVPLIFFTLVAGVLALGNPAKLGTIGLKTIFLYLTTTLFANFIGLTMGTIFQPGRGVDLGGAEPRQLAAGGGGFIEQIRNIIQKNPFEQLLSGDPTHLALSALLVAAAAFYARKSVNAIGIAFVAVFALGIAMTSMDILLVIFSSLVLGIALLFARGDESAVKRYFDFSSDHVLKVTHFIMELAPFGVFFLIAWVAGTRGIETFTAILSLTAAVYLGCAIHMLLVYGGIIKFGLKLPMLQFFRGILDAQMVAYSTSSSSATLPVTISNVTDNLGVKKAVAGSVLPLGSTINMDGTSLYLGIVALFTAQAFGYTLEPYHYILIAMTAALASIGAAGIPSASLFLLATVLQVFDVSAEHTALVVGFIFPFDRLLDMMRTVTNVTGDAAVAVTVAKWEKEIDEEVFRAKPVE